MKAVIAAGIALIASFAVAIGCTHHNDESTTPVSPPEATMPNGAPMAMAPTSNGGGADAGTAASPSDAGSNVP